MMNRYIKIALLLSGIAFAAASCNDTPQNLTKKGAVPTTILKNVTDIMGKVDPVCEMEFDTSWTEKTVYNNDTIFFCSDNCKKAFLAKPKKYIE